MNKIFYGLAVAAIIPALAIGSASDAAAKEHYKNWIDKQMNEISEDYDEAIAKIKKSSFTEDQKKVLSSQADTNRNLAVSHAKATDEQMAKNRMERENFKNMMKDSHENRKAVKEVDDIL